MEVRLSYCSSSGLIKAMDFSSRQSIILWSKERIEELGQLSLREQFRQQCIHRVVVKPKIGGYLSPSNTEKIFGVGIDSSYPLEWPLVAGHELAHTYFFTMKSRFGPRHINRRGVEAEDDKLEEICETFAEIWIRVGRNSIEVYELLGLTILQGGIMKI